MGSRSQGGWRIRLPAGEGRTVYTVRFRHAGRRYEESTGCSDPRAAAVEAAKIYADTVGGRRAARPVSGDLTTAVAEYIEDLRKVVSSEWANIVEIYFGAHLLPFFNSFSTFTLASYGDYGRHRLQEVARPSVRKELSALRRFVEWCREHDVELPPVPSLPKHGSPGKRTKNARKRKATIISPADAKRILMAMPDRSRRTGELVRPLFTVLYETGLRSKTVLKLETPLHYVRGQRHLFISREIDKEGFERKLPLTPAARVALDRACPKAPGRIFGAKASSLRHSFDAALAAAGLEDLDASPYDFRHTRLTHLANTPRVPLAGVSFLAGHKYLSTTSLYVQANEDAAKAALRAYVPRSSGGRSGGRRPKKPRAKGGT